MKQLELPDAAAQWADVLARVRCLVRFTCHHGPRRAPWAALEEIEATNPTHTDVAAACGAVARSWGAAADDVIRYVYTGRTT